MMLHVPPFGTVGHVKHFQGKNTGAVERRFFRVLVLPRPF